MNNKILMYHSVGYDKSFFTISPEFFIWQLEYIKKNNLNVVRLEELLEDFFSGNKKFKNSIALTFDDAYLNNFENVLPLVQKYNFPISIFVPTNLIGKNYKNNSGTELAIMSEEKIKLCIKSGLVDIYPHGHEHKISTEMTESEFETDVELSQRIIESLEGKKNIFCFPKGKINPDYKKVLEKLGIRFALSVKNGNLENSLDRYEICRVPIDSAVSKVKFKIYLSSYLNLYLKIKKILRRLV